MFLLAARQGYLPRALAELNQAGTPRRAILAQSAMIACAAVLLFVIVPTLLRLFLSSDLVSALFSGDQYGLLTSLAGSLWCGFLRSAVWVCSLALLEKAPPDPAHPSPTPGSVSLVRGW
ncbi:hypothetical protein [Ktedonobacter robiniae]|uniref:hypothetical protein n=1 Tax=Ktedonobacter robiniae TaxID=2778365 RepID=UPI0019153363